MDVRISTEGGIGFVLVMLDGVVVGEVERVHSYRAPKKWSARVHEADEFSATGYTPSEVARVTDATSGAFLVAHAAYESMQKARVLAKLDTPKAEV